jgi:hypothetical protein
MSEIKTMVWKLTSDNDRRKMIGKAFIWNDLNFIVFFYIYSLDFVLVVLFIFINVLRTIHYLYNFDIKMIIWVMEIFCALHLL